ncbi:MAG: sensor histidine kinase, partial [Hominenteromicrobium sp.]
VDTLKVQLWYLTGVMILLALVLALFIASRLSRPIEQINASAKQLAAGTYDIRFPEQGAREVSELAATLNYAAEELSKTENLRRELIANVSHDLRTPLTMISGYAEVMRDIPGENTPENVQVIIDEANRLAGLVNDLLDLSKLQAGVMTLSEEDFNLTEDVRGTLRRYDKLADYSFPFSCDRDVYVRADRLKISQVIYNLVSNAINYCGADKTVSLCQTVSGGVVHIEIRDTGEGIPADKLPYIWDRYYKVDREHRRAQIGTGLGLSIVKNILDLHGGRYGVASEVGRGSTFWFELPVRGEEPDTAEE